MRSHNAPRCCTEREEERDGWSSTCEISFEVGMKSWRLIDFYEEKKEESDRLRLENTEIQLVFLGPLFFCCHIGRGKR